MRAASVIVMAGSMLVACGTAAAQTPPPKTLGPTTTPQIPQRPAPQPVFDDKINLATRLNEASIKAKAEGTRVLLILGTESRQFGTALTEVMSTWDVSRNTGLEYQVIWASVGASGEGPANLARAKELGVDVAQDAEHATIVVVDDAQKVVAKADFASMLDAIRKRVYSSTKVIDFLQAHRAPSPVAQEKLDAALAKAKAANRSVLLTFGTFGDGWSLRWRNVLRDPQARTAIEKVAIVVDIELVRDKDAYALLEKFGGKSVQSTPWFALLDADGKTIAASQTEKTPNIGFPSKDEEIEAFFGILGAGKIVLEAADKQAIRAAIQRERERP